MMPGLFPEQGRCSIDIGEIPCEKHCLYLQGLQLPYKHLMIGIAGDEHHIVEFSECSKFVSFKGKPYIHPFLYHFGLSVALHFTQMFIMENHIVLYQCIFKFSFIIKQMLVVGLFHAETSAEIMSLCDLAVGYMNPLFH